VSPQKKGKTTDIKPPNHASYTNFINKERLMLPSKVCIDVRDEPWTLSHGFLYCTCCNKQIAWNNRTKHMDSEKHIKAKQNVKLTKEKAVKGAMLAQARIAQQNLVGSSYTTDRIFSSRIWLQAVCEGNITLGSFESMRVGLFSVFCALAYAICDVLCSLTYVVFVCFVYIFTAPAKSSEQGKCT
jgi:hypothetical protein